MKRLLYTQMPKSLLLKWIKWLNTILTTEVFIINNEEILEADEINCFEDLSIEDMKAGARILVETVKYNFFII
jgi:hypothetical protein